MSILSNKQPEIWVKQRTTTAQVLFKFTHKMLLWPQNTTVDAEVLEIELLPSYDDLYEPKEML